MLDDIYTVLYTVLYWNMLDDIHNIYICYMDLYLMTIEWNMLDDNYG